MAYIFRGLSTEERTKMRKERNRDRMRLKRAHEKTNGNKAAENITPTVVDSKESDDESNGETDEQYAKRLDKQRIRQHKLRDSETPWQRQIRNDNKSEKDEEKSDINPVYGTYEVTYDPVAEVIEDIK